MSGAALQSLATAAAATIYDAIGVAETGAELDSLAKLIWQGILTAPLATPTPRILSSISSGAVLSIVTDLSR